jgi:flagellar assembly protein FliH
MAVDAMRPFELPALEPVEFVPVAPEPVVPPEPEIDLEAEAAAARAEGHEAGFQAGFVEARAQLAPVIDALRCAAGEVAAHRDHVSAAVEVQAVELAMGIAEQILGAALEVQPERVVDAVRGALRRLIARKRITILVHPDDLELVRAAADELVAELGGIEHCEVQAERRVARGGAVVRTVEGEVDATLPTKLARVREVLEQELAPAEPAGA